MAVKIRLQRQGRKKVPFYYIVVADSRSPRDGKFIERLGSYNPLPQFPEIDINVEKSIHWLDRGALPTKTVKSIFSQNGILYKRHLLRGVKMGVVTAEQAEEKFAAYIQDKATKLNAQLAKVRESMDKNSRISIEREAKINEVRAKKIMEKRVQAVKAKTADTEAEAEETDDTIEAVAEVAPEVVAEVAPEVVAEVTPEVVDEVAPEAAPEVAPEEQPEKE